MLRATIIRFCVASLAAAVLALAPTWATAQLGVRPTQPKADYFRFKAKYTVIATGEAVQFDLVRPCFAVSGRDSAGDSVGLTPHKPGGYFNGVEIFPKVTSDHHAIIVRIPRACGGGTTANGGVPKDLMPFATWFDDADDLRYGWQYASEDAYKSPLAKIRFDGASVEPAGLLDFWSWKRHASDGFRSSKKVLHPYGLSFEQLNTPREIAGACHGVRRLTLPDEIRELARAAWPDGKPRFWMVPLQAENRTPAQDALYRAIWTNESQHHHFNDGNTLQSLGWGTGFPAPSVPTRTHGAMVLTWLRPPDFFPRVSDPFGFPFLTPEQLASKTIYIDTDVRPDMRGFLTCYVDGSPLADIKSRLVQWRLDGETVAGQSPGLRGPPNTVFERDEFAYEYARNAM
jgi:hypothetical protein